MKLSDQIVRFIRGVAVALLILLCTSQQASAVGQCREVNCPCTDEQLKQGMVDTPQGCSKCNRAALEKAKAEFKKWYSTYKEQVEMRDRLYANVDESLEEGRKVLEEYWAGELISKLPHQMKIAYELSKGNREGQLKAMATALKEMLKLIKSGAYASAVKVAGVAEMVLKLGIMTEKALIKIEEADKILAGAQKIADAAYESLQKARMAKEKMDQLEKDCQAESSGKAKPSASEDEMDQWESSAEREAEAAREILKSWKKVEGGYEDMDGNFHDADLAFDEALEMVQALQGTSIDARHFRVSLQTTGEGAPQLAQQRGNELTDQQVAKFGRTLERGVEHLVIALEAFDLVLKELGKIGQLSKNRSGTRR